MGFLYMTALWALVGLVVGSLRFGVLQYRYESWEEPPYSTPFGWLSWRGPSLICRLRLRWLPLALVIITGEKYWLW
jgi:hypothetical protein